MTEAAAVDMDTVALAVAVGAAGLVLTPRVLRRFALPAERRQLCLERLRQRPWTASDGAWLLLGAFAVWTAFPLLAPVIAPNASTVLNTLTAGFVVAAVTVAIAAWRLKRAGISWDEAVGIRPATWPHDIVTGVIAGIAVWPWLFIVSLVNFVLLEALGIEISPQTSIELLEGRPPAVALVPLIALVTVAAPFSEELFFRGIMLPLLSAQTGLAPAVIITSMLFAAIHFHLPSLLPLTALAIALALAYIRSGSLLTAVGMHATFNAITVALVSVGGSP